MVTFTGWCCYSHCNSINSSNDNTQWGTYSSIIVLVLLVTVALVIVVVVTAVDIVVLVEVVVLKEVITNRIIISSKYIIFITGSYNGSRSWFVDFVLFSCQTYWKSYVYFMWKSRKQFRLDSQHRCTQHLIHYICIVPFTARQFRSKFPTLD